MNDRHAAWRRLAAVMELQLESIRALDVDGYTAAQAEFEAACMQLRECWSSDVTPLDQAWASTVRRLSSSVQASVETMLYPWTEVARAIAAKSTGRAGPIGLDCRI